MYRARLDGDDRRGNQGVRRGRGGIETTGVVASVRDGRAGGQIGADLLRVCGRRWSCSLGGNTDEMNFVVARVETKKRELSGENAPASGAVGGVCRRGISERHIA